MPTTTKYDVADTQREYGTRTFTRADRAVDFAIAFSDWDLVHDDVKALTRAVAIERLHGGASFVPVGRFSIVPLYSGRARSRPGRS